MPPPGRPSEPQLDPAYGVELLAERITRLVLHLSALADRYDTAGAPTSATSLERASRLRAAIAMGRQELTDLSLESGRYDSLADSLADSRVQPTDDSGASEVAGKALDHDVWRLLAIREVIAQAQGVLMQRHHLGPDQALTSLLTQAQERGVTAEPYARSILEDATASVGGRSQSESQPTRRAPHHLIATLFGRATRQRGAAPPPPVETGPG